MKSKYIPKTVKGQILQLFFSMRTSFRFKLQKCFSITLADVIKKHHSLKAKFHRARVQHVRCGPFQKRLSAQLRLEYAAVLFLMDAVRSPKSDTNSIKILVDFQNNTPCANKRRQK